MKDDDIVRIVRQWVESFIVELNLCPFAKRELVKNRVRFVVTDATTEDQLMAAIQAELELLDRDPSVGTTLLIHPKVLQDFDDYNQFLNFADRFLAQLRMQGVYQIASFHPDYQFSGTDPDDAENYTNRSPYAMLHLLREESLKRVIADYPDVDQIPVHNIELMNRLGQDKLQALLQACFEDNSNTLH
ncbi:MAG: DUF1415 domain-containing protein [Betaproteobacteria bacterium]|nr:DUF1415 domain-containing protein [Betaproteobacteria bacterium]